MKYLNAIATLVLMLVATTALAQGNGTETNKYDISLSNFPNPCCNDFVSITGTIHESFRLVDNGDGTVTITNHSAASNIKGTGSDGTKYVGSETTKGSQTIGAPPGPFSIDYVQYTKLIGTGRDGHECTFKIKITWHLQIDADGNVVVDDYDIELICSNGTILE